MTEQEYLKDVKGLKKKIERLNENCKGLILEDGDYEVIVNELTKISITLARNKLTYLENKYNHVMDICNDLVRRTQR